VREPNDAHPVKPQGPKATSPAPVPAQQKPATPPVVKPVASATPGPNQGKKEVGGATPIMVGGVPSEISAAPGWQPAASLKEITGVPPGFNVVAVYRGDNLIGYIKGMKLKAGSIQAVQGYRYADLTRDGVVKAGQPKDLGSGSWRLAPPTGGVHVYKTPETPGPTFPDTWFLKKKQTHGLAHQIESHIYQKWAQDPAHAIWIYNARELYNKNLTPQQLMDSYGYAKKFETGGFNPTRDLIASPELDEVYSKGAFGDSLRRRLPLRVRQYINDTRRTINSNTRTVNGRTYFSVGSQAFEESNALKDAVVTTSVVAQVAQVVLALSSLI